MTPIDRIRFHLIRARTQEARSAGGATGNETIPHLLAEALVVERKARGAATRERLTEGYGFTAAEIDRHSRAALDRATEHWARYCDPRPFEGAAA